MSLFNYVQAQLDVAKQERRLKQVADALRFEYSYVNRLANRRIKDPGIKKVELLAAYFFAKAAERGRDDES